jgi:hypothetical protein
MRAQYNLMKPYPKAVHSQKLTTLHFSVKELSMGTCCDAAPWLVAELA